MSQYTPEQLDEILAKHRKWRLGDGGKRADLSGADLSGANLNGADLSGADLNGEKILTLVARANRSDGCEFIAFATDTDIIIRAECRTLSLAEYRKHVAAQYPDTDKAVETLDILDFIELRASRAAQRAGEGE